MISITRPELRAAIATIGIIQKQGLPEPLAEQVGMLWGLAETALYGGDTPDDNKEILELDVTPVPVSYIRESFKGRDAWPIMFKGDLNKFIDFEA